MLNQGVFQLIPLAVTLTPEPRKISSAVAYYCGFTMRQILLALAKINSHMRGQWRPACPTIHVTAIVFNQQWYRPHTILVLPDDVVSRSAGVPKAYIPMARGSPGVVPS